MHKVLSTAISIAFILLLMPLSYATVDLSKGRTDVQSFAGSFVHTVPIAVAPGRAGMQPALALNYSSSMGNGLYGMDWNMDITRIERETKHGAPSYSSADTFVLVMKGARQTLVNVAGSEYRVANESAFLKLTKSGNSWIIEDQNNTVYTLAAPWPMTSANAFSWSLSHVVDINGNTMDYAYADGGQGHRPLSITYGPNNRVDFKYEHRPDLIVNYRSGQRSDISVRLRTVRSYVGTQKASHIEFRYAAPKVHDSRSLLSKATVVDVDGILPSRSTSFGYTLKNQSAANGEWNTPWNHTIQTTNRVWSRTTRIYHDVNGDGVAEQSIGTIWRNGNGSFTAPFTLPDAGISPKGAGITRFDRAIVDMNGDGYHDWVFRDATGVWRIYFNDGANPVAAYESWADPSGQANGHAFYDVNGDGLPDLLRLINAATWWLDASNWMVYLNKGNGFETLGFSVNLAMAPFPKYSGRIWSHSMTLNVPAILTNQKFNAKPLMTSVTDEMTGLTKQVEYALQGGIANMPTLKLWTVKRIATSGPNVETRSSVYSYSGGLFVLSKMEFRGFGTVIQSDEQTGAVTTTNYAQDIVFQGRPTVVTTSLNGATLSTATTTWAAKEYDAGKRHFAYPGTVHQVGHDLNGMLLEDTTTTSIYDEFGHILSSITQNADGFSKQLANTYSGSDTCAPIPTMVTRQRLVPNPIPAYIRNSWKYRQQSNWLRHRSPVFRARAAAYFAALNARNWGSHWESYQEMGTIPDGACWKVRKLTGAVVTSSSPTDRQTRKSSFTYDANGFLKSETIEPDSAALSQTTTYAYDSFGNRITTAVSGVGIAARTTTVTYDANGMFPVSTTNALGHTESYTWDARFGNKLSLTGPNGLTTSWQYDGFGRKIREDRADGTFTAIDLSNAPASVTTTAFGSNPSTAWYDAMGRKIRSVSTGFDGVLIYNEVAYDSLGRKWKEYLPYTAAKGAFTEYAYDELSRPIRVTNPNGDVATSSYKGLSVTTTNALGQSKITVKNSQGKVVTVTDHLGGVMSYGYDANGNLTSTTDAAGNITTMSYDIRGRKIGMNDPDMGVWSYQYDVLGNLISQTDAKGQTTTMVYDKLGRMTSRNEAEGTSRWSYDTQWIGGLSSETGGIASKAYVYNTFGRVKSTHTIINGQSYSVSMTYDNIGRVSTITYPTGLTIQRNYNQFHYMVSVSNVATGGIIWQANSVDEFGHTTSESFGNGVVTTRVFDNLRGVMTGMQSSSGGSTIQDWNYDYDAVGNMRIRIDNVMGYNESFTYDGLNRLKTVTGADNMVRIAAFGQPIPADKSYAYDAIGNITHKSDVGDYTYDLNHPHAVATAGGNSYTYDTNGNMTAGAGRTHSWTSFNKPLGITTANGYTGFGYDANHNRITKSTPTSTTNYIGKIYEQITMGGLTKDISHIYAGSKLVASIEDVAGITSTKYMHGDHLGSINVITDETGAVLERLSFDAFGKPRNANGTDPVKSSVMVVHTTRGYTGHEMDASTGLINMNARLYDPVLGRFISADTIVPSAGNMQDFNRYSYVLNNPLAYTDPSGHSWWTKFRDNFFVPVAQQITTVIVASLVMAASIAVGMPMDPSVAMGIGGFTSSMIFGGNGKENVTSGIMAAATYKIGHSGFKDETRYLLHGALTATNYRINGGDAMQGFFVGFISTFANGRIIAGVDTGNGFTDFAIQTTLSAMIGGTTSAAMGGSFAEGARNGVRIMLMNEMGNVVMDRLTKMAMGEVKYVNTSADNAAFGERPDDPKALEGLANTLEASGALFPPAAPVAGLGSFLLHLRIYQLNGDVSPLQVDATTQFFNFVFGNSPAAVRAAYGLGQLIENSPPMGSK